MAIYRFECVLRFDNGRRGVEVDIREFDARNPDEAIALAKFYQCAKPMRTVASGTLFAPSGAIVWTMKLAEGALDES